MDNSLITLRVDPKQREFFLKLISMLGFAEIVAPSQMIRNYQMNAPMEVPLEEEDIMNEIKAHREV